MSQTDFTFCTFRTAGRWFGIPIEDVKEVSRHARTTRIPHATSEVAGYVNVRGHIFLALDMAHMLGLAAAVNHDRHMILFKANVGPSFGIIVDEIGDITTVEESQIDPISSIGQQESGEDSLARTGLIVKVCRCPEELLIVLDPRKFLTVVEKALSIVE